MEDPDNPRLTVEDMKEIMSYDPEAEVARLEEKLDATERQLDTLQSKLTEMEQCLSWASQNVWRIEPHSKEVGGWFCISKPGESQEAPTLYAALKSAWEARDK